MNHPKAITAILLATLLSGCSEHWTAFRHDQLRTAGQLHSSALADPARVGSLHVVWTFNEPHGGVFRASPVVYKNRVYIGSSAGFFYALDANTGTVVWQYPSGATTTLTSTFTCNPSSEGIASSATVTKVRGRRAVVFAAPDRSFGGGLGDGRLFALDAASGTELWKSATPVARLTGPAFTDFHEQMGYSSPLVYEDRLYVGIGNHCDNPIQKGRVVAVNVDTGAVDSAFGYCSTGTCADSTRGGGVWSSPAGWGDAVYITTGNTRSGAPVEPSPNNGLSLIRLNYKTGAINWKFQPVPWALDHDPDWSAGATVMNASCGTIIASTQKDGWTHALNAATGAKLWSFPPNATPFTTGDGTFHGDTRYMKGIAIWNDVIVGMNGGLNLTASGADGGYGRLHAFNACAPAIDRLRWLVDVPNSGTLGTTYRLGPPTMTRGIVFVGTTEGHLVVIADPARSPAVGSRCSNPDVPTASCVPSGYKLVPQPAVLANVALAGSMVYNEPALANGRVYASTQSGRVYMLRP
jgi:outer membrane protein assembly factor BamB